MCNVCIPNDDVDKVQYTESVMMCRKRGNTYKKGSELSNAKIHKIP